MSKSIHEWLDEEITLAKAHADDGIPFSDFDDQRQFNYAHTVGWLDAMERVRLEIKCGYLVWNDKKRQAHE
jgi:hypothetical protein